METESKPLTEEEYCNSLKIESEADLLFTNESTGETSYVFITEEDVKVFKEETEHVKRVVKHAIEEIKWCVRKKELWNGIITSIIPLLKISKSMQRQFIVFIVKSTIHSTETILMK